MAKAIDQGEMGDEPWIKRLPEGVDLCVRLIDKDWDSFEFDTTATPTPQATNGYLLHRMVVYMQRGYTDTTLWECFREDFEGWTLDIWKVANKEIVRDFRNFLRRYGVIVKMTGDPIMEQLQAVINSPKEPEWTKEEIEYQLNKVSKTSAYNSKVYGSFLSYRNPYRELTAEEIRYNQAVQQHIQQPAQQPVYQRTIQQPVQQPPQQPVYQPSVYQPAQEPAYQLVRQLRQAYTPTPTPTPTPGGAIVPPGGIMPTKEVSTLRKIYTDQDQKYGGEEYDILDAKLQIFYDLSNQSGLQPYQYQYAFSTMLKGRALAFYYKHIQGKMLDFDTMVQLIRANFENDETHQAYLSEWQETTFPRIISENPDKTRSECLKLLFQKLETIQTALPDHQGDQALRDQVILACRGVPECSLALFQPGKTYTSICAQLRSAVATAMRTTPQSQFPQEENEAMWTDRTYRGQGNYRGRGNTHRGFRARSNQRGNTGSETREKKCYICNKPNCWSTKHTPSERKQAYERFKQRSRYPSKAHYQAFLAEIEGVETVDTGDETDTGGDTEIDQLITDWEDNKGFT